jgi:ketosteroid isomerase-like protein
VSAARGLQNVDVVRRFYDAWSRDDLPGPVDLLDPEVEYANPDGAIEPGTRRGVDAFIAAVEMVFEAWEYWRAEIEALEPVGDDVIAVVSYTARGRGSGVEIRGRESALWTLRDGKVTRYQWFHGPDDASEAAPR